MKLLDLIPWPYIALFSFIMTGVGFLTYNAQILAIFAPVTFISALVFFCQCDDEHERRIRREREDDKGLYLRIDFGDNNDE